MTSPWLDLKVFYVRLSDIVVDDCTPEILTLSLIPASPHTVIEVNGKRSSIYTECMSSSLRRDRFDKKSEEAIFVSTDSIRVTGTVTFQVFHNDDLLITGELELCNSNGSAGESKISAKKWNLSCRAAPTFSGLAKGKMSTSSKSSSPLIELYVAGSFYGAPIILTGTAWLNFSRKYSKAALLDSIPEDEVAEDQKVVIHEDSRKASEIEEAKQEADVDIDYESLYSRAVCLEGEDGDLSWFNAGVRVGVGISLGICIGVGIGAGMLVRAYQATRRNLRR